MGAPPVLPRRRSVSHLEADIVHDIRDPQTGKLLFRYSHKTKYVQVFRGGRWMWVKVSDPQQRTHLDRLARSEHEEEIPQE